MWCLLCSASITSVDRVLSSEDADITLTSGDRLLVDTITLCWYRRAANTVTSWWYQWWGVSAWQQCGGQEQNYHENPSIAFVWRKKRILWSLKTIVVGKLDLPMSASSFISVIFIPQFVEVSNQLIEWPADVQLHTHYDWFSCCSHSVIHTSFFLRSMIQTCSYSAWVGMGCYFGTARRGLGGAAACPGSSSLYQM